MKSQLSALLATAALLVLATEGLADSTDFKLVFPSFAHGNSAFGGNDFYPLSAEASAPNPALGENDFHLLSAQEPTIAPAPLADLPPAMEPVPGEAEACATGQCGAGCQKACCRPCIRFFGEVLLLRPGNDKVSFAVPINSGIVPPAGAAPVQIGPEGIVDCDFEGGFRLGFAFRLDSCSELGLTYSHFEADTTNAISRSGTNVLRSLVSHPGAVATPTDFLNASARYDIDFQIVDLDYRRVLSRGNRYSLNYVLGLRYAHLGQIFDARFTNATTIETVSTEIRFDGGGIRFGLEGDRKIGDCGFLVYSRAAASLLGGNFRGRYVQSDNFRGTVANTGWSEDGVISILDLELGVGWTSRGGCVRLTTGYLFSGWFNALATDEFIQGVQTNNSVAVGDTLTFDGLSMRTEIRF